MMGAATMTHAIYITYNGLRHHLADGRAHLQPYDDIDWRLALRTHQLDLLPEQRSLIAFSARAPRGTRDADVVRAPVDRDTAGPAGGGVGGTGGCGCSIAGNNRDEAGGKAGGAV